MSPFFLNSHGRKNILVELKESCDVEAFTPSLDVITSQPNTSTSSVNVTSSTLTATSPALNATLTTANVTESGLFSPQHCVQLCSQH